MRLSRAIAPLLLAFVVGCESNDTTGPDDPGRAGAGAGGQRSGGKGGSGAAGRSGAGAAAGRSGEGGGSAGRSGASGGGQGGETAPADGGTSDGMTPVGPVATDPECDLNGIWIARLTTFSRDSVFSAVQTASNWFYLEIEQDEEAVTITDSLDCGIQVSGSADVTLNRATTEALLKRNVQTGRGGTFGKDDDQCGFSIDRFYSVRGVPRATYLADLDGNPALSDVEPALPTQANSEGSEDWDDDGSPGIAFQVAALGTRHVAQRDWNEFFSNGDYPIALSADEFVAAAQFDSQENLLGTSGTFGGLLGAGSTPIVDGKHRIVFRRLGRSASDEAVTAVRVESDLDTCYNVQDALPHDAASM